jgi:hypothetical protein
MSMELHVFFHGVLPSKEALNKAMQDLGFPFVITPTDGSLDEQNGAERPLTDEECELVKIPRLAFGDFEWPVKCALSFLRNAGLGEVT